MAEKKGWDYKNTSNKKNGFERLMDWLCCRPFPKPVPPQHDPKQYELSPKDRQQFNGDLFTSKIVFNIKKGNDQQKKVELKDFKQLKVIGKGGQAKVVLAEYLRNGKLYAMKIIRKDIIYQKNMVLQTKDEKDIMIELKKNPFIVNLKFAFQSDTRVYMVLEFCQGGSLFYQIVSNRRLNENRARFYSAQILLGLEQMHNNGLIYRDLKPENILIAKDGYIKITDFGLSKKGMQDGMLAYSQCGTPIYFAPEIIINKGYEYKVDIWCLANLIYEMVTGIPPFYLSNNNIQNTLINILMKPVQIKPYFSKELQSLLRAMFQTDPVKRISIQQIKSHKFYDGIDWKNLQEKIYEAPFVPQINGRLDLKYFMPIQDTSINETTIHGNSQINQGNLNVTNFEYVGDISQITQNDRI